MPFNSLNRLDDIALYQSLQRIPGETDESFLERIKRIATVRYGASYKTLTESIAIQAGFPTKPVLMLECTSPFIIDITNEYITISTSDNLYIRIFINNFSSNNILELLKTTLGPYTLSPPNKFTITEFIEQSEYSSFNNKQIVRTNNTKYGFEVIDTNTKKLAYSNIVPGSESSTGAVIRNKKASPKECTKSGDYYIDYTSGFIYSYSAHTNSTTLSYRYYQPRFVIHYTEISLTPLELYYKYGLNDDFVSLVKPLLDDKVIDL